MVSALLGVYLLSVKAGDKSGGACNLADGWDMHACTPICEYAYVSLRECVHGHACVCVHVSLSISGCMCMCIFACMLHVCMCLCCTQR